MSEQPRHDEPPRQAYPEQNADGVDLTLICENLKLTPLERVRKAERLRQHVLRMHKLAGIKRDPNATTRVKEHIRRPKDAASLAELRAIRDERERSRGGEGA